MWYIMRSVHVTGSDNVWQHDERSHGSSRRAIQPKHWTMFLIKEYPPGTPFYWISFKLTNECFMWLFADDKLMLKVSFTHNRYLADFGLRQWCRWLKHCPLVYVMWARLKIHRTWKPSGRCPPASWKSWRKHLSTVRLVSFNRSSTGITSGFSII